MADKKITLCDLCPDRDNPNVLNDAGLRFRLDVVLTRLTARKDSPVMIEKLDVCELCAPRVVELLRAR